MSTHTSSVENNVPTKPILIKERLTFPHCRCTCTPDQNPCTSALHRLQTLKYNHHSYPEKEKE